MVFRVLPVSLRRFSPGHSILQFSIDRQRPAFRFAELRCQHEVLKVCRAQAPLELVDDSPHLSRGLMGAGNIEGLARMPILEMRWTGSGFHIAEDLVHYDIVGRGVESQLSRVDHAAFYQLPKTSGIDLLQAFGLPPTAQAPVITRPCPRQ